MKIYGQSSIANLMGDRLVFRNLVPVDQSIPSFSTVCTRLGLTLHATPRKTTPDYARVLVEILKQARKKTAPTAELQRVIYVGDTRMNDGEAFLNICRAGGWQGMGFIGADRDAPFKMDIERHEHASLYLANRWQALTRFHEDVLKAGGSMDENTVLLLDIDKTILGARGRNDSLIDLARMDAARKLAADTLGNHFNPVEFQQAYDCLNQPEFHAFTSDNQDYLVYTCLVLNSRLLSLDDLLQTIQPRGTNRFSDFVMFVDERKTLLPPGMKAVHTGFYERYQNNDPTPFKQFRCYEYLNTEKLLLAGAATGSADELLKKAIVITHEVYALAETWQKGGTMIFGLSDKPDEASLPSDELKAEGHQPIHRIITQIIGCDCDDARIF